MIVVSLSRLSFYCFARPMASELRPLQTYLQNKRGRGHEAAAPAHNVALPFAGGFVLMLPSNL
jgi:hypothetical protein